MEVTMSTPCRGVWRERVVIPIHGNKTLKIGLQRSLMKMITVHEDEL